MRIEEKGTLQRFETAQNDIYETALKELKAGKKRVIGCGLFSSQFRGMGSSEMSRFYTIQSMKEAKLILELFNPRQIVLWNVLKRY